LSAYGLLRLVWGLRVVGRENIPATGPCLVTSNHISHLDPPIVGCVIPREAGFAAKRELFAVPGLGWLIASLNSIPVDRARLTLGTLRALGSHLESGKALVYFPEGTRSRDGKLREARVGVGMLLTKYPVAIVPAYVEGTDSPLRSLLRRGRMRVVFGRPYALPEEDRSPEGRRESYRRIAEAVMDRIRRLKEGPEPFDRETGAPAVPRPAAGARIREKDGTEQNE
jgi:1-acyl-sn-glycerol-3-phosphate acyltransferase